MLGARMRDRTWAAAVIIVGAALLACKSSSGACRAKLTFEGKPFEATGDDPDKAKTSVCLGWCSTYDVAVDAAWKSWKATPEGSKSSDTRFGEVYSAVPGGKDLLERCKARCLTHIATTQPTPVAVTCP